MAQRFRLFRDGAILLAFFVLLVLIAAKLDEVADSVVHGPFYAIDGDTLSVGGERLRLQGLDAPELDQTCEDDKAVAWACGRAAKRLLQQLVADGPVECRGRERDRYHRLLVRCHAQNKNTADTNINAAMVRLGLAVGSGYYADEQMAARRERRGLWAGRFELPRQWRVSRGMMDEANLVETFSNWMKRWSVWE